MRLSPPSFHALATRTARGRHRPGWRMVAAVATLGVVGSLMTAAPSAHAAESSIAAAVESGSFLQDVVDGRISVEQLVDANIAGAGHGAPSLDRATLTQGIAAEVEQLRTTGTVEAWGHEEGLGAPHDPTAAAGEAGSGADPTIAAQLSFWHRFTHFFHHWTTITINTLTGGALLGGGTAAGIASVVAGLFGLLASAIFVSLGASAFVTLGAVSVSCTAHHFRYLRITMPDLGNSHCAN